MPFARVQVPPVKYQARLIDRENSLARSLNEASWGLLVSMKAQRKK
jgi:hypothetical protein